VCSQEPCVEAKRTSEKSEVLFVTNSKAECVMRGVTNSSVQPFPQQNRGE
jgi:hypothetical protein